MYPSPSPLQRLSALPILALMVGFLLWPAVIQGQTEEVDRERFEQIAKDYEKDANDAVGDRKLLRKVRSKTSQDILDLVEECEDSELAIEMLNWVITRNGVNRKSKQAFSVIIERFPDKPGIGDALGAKTKKEDIQIVLEKNSDPEVIAVANLVLALREEDLDKREKMLLDLKENHGDASYRGTTVLKMTEGPLAALMFRVGKVAPDIVGPDIDGVEFRLSDYRGKVVVLDFWGDW